MVGSLKTAVESTIERLRYIRESLDRALAAPSPVRASYELHVVAGECKAAIRTLELLHELATRAARKQAGLAAIDIAAGEDGRAHTF